MPASRIFVLQGPPTTIAISDFALISLPPWFGGAAHVSRCHTDLFSLPAALYQVHQCSVQSERGAGSASIQLLGGTSEPGEVEDDDWLLGILPPAGLWWVVMQKCRMWG